MSPPQSDSIVFLSSKAYRLKSIVTPDSPLVPDILYVVLATLNGSVFPRSRVFWNPTLPRPFILSRRPSPDIARGGLLLDSLGKARKPAAYSAMTWENDAT